MIKRDDLVVGRCPGALGPMASGDGLIVRVRPRLGRISLIQLEALAEAAARHGDGNLYLSNRANIQIRAVKSEAHAPALDILRAADLVDSDLRAEAVRNVMLVPGFGPGARPAVAAELAARLEALLARTQALHNLPGKFGVAIQPGQTIDAGAIGDITFLVQEDRIAMLLDGGLGGAASFEGTGAAAEGYLRTALAFLKAREEDLDIRRMRTALSKLGPDRIAKKAGLTLDSHNLSISHSVEIGELGEAFGMAFPFGEVTQTALQAITQTMRAHEIGAAAVSPHRALIFSCTEQEKVTLKDVARRIGAITNPKDIRLRLHVCPGQPACSRATVPARKDAEAVLAALNCVPLPKGVIHISGCEKRCAYPHEASITAIGAEGVYTLSGPQPHLSKRVAPANLAVEVKELAKILS